MTTGRKHNCDFIQNTLPDGCAKLIIADPPYFEVKGEFDFIWDSHYAYLEDVKLWRDELHRLLADNGTLFWYGHALKIAYQQVLFDERFNLINSLVWEKAQCQTLRNEVGALRGFAPVTERILMYEKCQSVGEAQWQKTGLQAISDNPDLFKSLKVYFDNWLLGSGLTLKQAVEQIGSSCTHWFGFTIREKQQFAFPTREKWLKMAEIHPHFAKYKVGDSTDETIIEYEDHRIEYEDLRREYEDLRRFFKLDRMTTDVLKFSQESHITGKYKHDTVKPEMLTRLLIRSTTKPGDLIFIPFAGSGTECAMAEREGREFIGFDINPEYVDMANDRVQRERLQIKLL